MKKLIAWSVCFLLGGSVMAQGGNDAADKKTAAGATKEHPFVNSLGMKFVPVPGTQALFSIWDTRVEDFREYAREAGYVQSGGIYVMKVKKNVTGGGYGIAWELDKEASWENPGFKQGKDHPVVGVSWNEAKAFCAWLTEKERKSGRIGAGQDYRLPADEEWSAAVGAGKYPWGNDWPPLEGAGNYDPSLKVDDFENTSAVGSFKANQLGLYDMGGNVFQWCEDRYPSGRMNQEPVLDPYPALKKDGGEPPYRVLRGASWFRSAPGYLLSSHRSRAVPDDRNAGCGFRCVLVSGLSSR